MMLRNKAYSIHEPEFETSRLGAPRLRSGRHGEEILFVGIPR